MEMALYMIQNALRYIRTTKANQNDFECYRKLTKFQFPHTTFVMIEFQAKEISTFLYLMEFALRQFKKQNKLYISIPLLTI
jgi:hypothetical protein